MTTAMEVDAPPAPPAAPTKRTRGETLLSAFSSYRAELDAHYDRRERIIKLSRDVTALSKKLIFALHRITSRDKEAVMKEAEEKFVELEKLFVKLSGEVQGEAYWRYRNNVSPGVEEYIEGMTFHHFLLHHTLPSLELVQASLSAPLLSPTTDPSTDPTASTSALPASEPPEPLDLSRTPYVHVTTEDYLGGIADLTGELMRLAIGSVGRSLGAREGEGDGLASVAGIAAFVREIKGEMDPLGVYVRNLNKKLVVLDQSLSKIETASYALKIRTAEYSGSPVMLEAFAKGLAEGKGGAGVEA